MVATQLGVRRHTTCTYSSIVRGSFLNDSLDLTYLVEYLEEQHALLVGLGLERAAAPRRGGEQRVRAPPVAARVALGHAGRCHAARES